MDFVLGLTTMNTLNYILKIFFISVFSYYTSLKITNRNKNLTKQNILKAVICIIVATIISGKMREKTNLLNSISSLIILLTIIFSTIEKCNFGNAIFLVIISLSINYSLFGVASILGIIPTIIFNIQNIYISFIIIELIYALLLYAILKIKRIKNGIVFLNNKINNEYLDILILNISIMVLFIIVISGNYESKFTASFLLGFVILAIIMVISIQKSLQLYYKQKMLVRALDETKEELAKKEKEVEELEAENLNFSKKSHTLAHKQKSLEYKLQEIMLKAEISNDEVGELNDRIKEIGKDLYKEKTTIELDKTEIPEIDDMLKYMQSECIKNKIDFELQLKGNIHFMTNNLISKEDLETLLADHIKNAIIAINHTDNVNRSILVRLGEIDKIFSLYIYDSGSEFEKETLANLGKKPSTTHADEGGTGMGFMNTFDTLRKCKASLTIEEYNKPSKDNYTKALIIKFDNKNEFKIKSYRQNEIDEK